MNGRPLAATLAAIFLGILAGGWALAQAADDGDDGKIVDDVSIVARVKADLQKVVDVSGMKLGVQARNGVVTLTGTTQDATDSAGAERVASAVAGVRSVNNRIKVKPPKELMGPEGVASPPSVPTTPDNSSLPNNRTTMPMPGQPAG